MKQYILAVDQSTQATKGMVFTPDGVLLARADISHAQLVDSHGWVEHDPEQILNNTLAVCRIATEKAGINKDEIAALGITNQRETVVAWDATTGKPVYNAIVWQCGRAAAICDELIREYPNAARMVQEKTGLPVSPYFSAPKITWLLRNVPELDYENLCCGTIDSWLIWNLCAGRPFKTDYSNASRTGLFNIQTLCWDKELCALYGVRPAMLPQVCMSDSLFGMTDLGGWLEKPIPLHSVLGDSHAALLGQNCRKPGEIKATYGTGSSVMMQTGNQCIQSRNGLVSSLAWGLDGKVEYVLEGNLNYTGAVISWLKNDVGLIATDEDSENLARQANPDDRCIFVPAFTGLGAPYWDSAATGLFTGITRTTGRAELVKACLDCIAYQIADLTSLMAADAGLTITELHADGGPTANRYLMQLQSDIAGVAVCVPPIAEISGLGAALAAAGALGLAGPASAVAPARYQPTMTEAERDIRCSAWRQAVKQTLTH